MKICSITAELLHMDQWTDMTEQGCSMQFCKRYPTKFVLTSNTV